VTRLANLVLRHRRLVFAFWLLAFLAGGAAAGQTAERLSLDFSLPGQPGDAAEQQLAREYGVSTFDTLVPTVTVPEGATVAERSADVAAAFDAVRGAVPQARVVDGLVAGDERFVTDDGRTAFLLVQGPLPEGFGPGMEVALEPALEQAAAAAGLESGLTSYGLLSAGGETEGPSVLIETLLGGLGALAVLAFVFASFLALVPLLIAAVSILTTFLLVFAMTFVTDVSFVVQFLVSLIGLGVAIDYSLLVVSRWREERAHGHDNAEAVVIAVRTAGHAVLASGVTVAISLVALLVVPVPFLRSMGLGGMLIPLVSVAVVLTLLPALLGGIGPRVDWPRIRKEGTAARGWSAWARLIVRRRFVAMGVGLVALGVLVLPVFDLRIGQSDLASLARSGPAFDALTELTDSGVAPGVSRPITCSSRGDARPRAAAGRVDGVRTAVSPSRRRRARGRRLPERETVDSDSTAVVDGSAAPRPRRGDRTSAAPARRSRTTAARCTTTSRTSCCSSPSSPSCCSCGRSARCCCRSRPCCSTCSRWRGVRRGRLLLAAGQRLRRAVRGVADRAPSPSGCRC
jgi:RND superfamily putative drug exporter